MPNPTPVHVVAGFLGVGKTTTIHAWMAAHPADRTAVIVNDFGEAAIDAAILGDGTAVTNIPGGCVCCTAPAGLARAIATVLEEVRPDRIFIEPSGLARPQDVVDMLARGGLKDRVALQPTIVLVDPTADAPAELREAQLASADILVANRRDLATPAALDALRAQVATLWPGPLRVIETEHGALPDDALAWPPGEGPALRVTRVATAPSTAGYRSRSWTFPATVQFGWDPLRALLGATPGVVRFKGLFTGDVGWCRVDVAGGRLHFAPTPWRRDNRADVIVDDTVDLDAFEAGLLACRLPEPTAEDAPTVALVDLDGFEQRLTREGLAGLPEQVPDVGVLVPGRVGTGVPLREVLALLPATGRFVVVANDGMTAGPTDPAGIGDAVLVHSLAGAPLPANQGGPFRLLAPAGEGRSNCANVKGVVRIRLVPG